MRKIVLSILLILSIWGASRYGTAQSPGSSHTADDGQSLTRYYIFVDNSQSMKGMHYYERVLSIIYENVNSEFHFVPFGSTKLEDLKNFTSLVEFLEFLNNNDFYTTDFEVLAEFIKAAKLEPTDQIIIITDGEHDSAANRPFSHLTQNELETMKRVAQTLKSHQKNIRIVHLLKNSPGAVKEITVDRYIQTFSEMKITVPGFDAISDFHVIKALTHDFLIRLAAKENYYYCKNRKETVQALQEKIFKLSIPVACDMSGFSRTIPVTLSFQFVPSHVRDRFRQTLSQGKVCFQGVERQFSITDNQDPTHAFPVRAEWVADDFYSIWVKDSVVWERRQIYMDSDFDQAVDTVKNHFKEIIRDAEMSIDFDYPGFVEPRCQVSIRFTGNLLFPFMDADNFNVYSIDCSGNLLNANRSRIHSSKYTRRFYIELPMASTRKITVTYPHANNETVEEFRLTPQRIQQFWNGDELVVEDARANIPLVNYHFDQYLDIYNGTIVLFSAANRRYVGKIDRAGSFQFYRGMKYWFYHVPADLEKYSITFSTREIDSQDDVKEALNLLDVSRQEALTGWEKCLKIFNDAMASGEEIQKNAVIKRLVESNGFLLLLANLGNITAHEKHKKDLLNILILYQDRYKGSSTKPFRAINLVKQEIPGFSKELKDKYIGLENQKKTDIIIAILANPNTNLDELRYYLLEEYEKVSPQNLEYFRILEGVKK